MTTIQALRLAWQAAPRQAAIQAAITPIQAALPLIVLWTMKQLIDVTINNLQNPSADIATSLLQTFPSLLSFGAAILAMLTTQNFSEVNSLSLTQKTLDHITNLIHQKASSIPYNTLQNPQYQTKAYRTLTTNPNQPVRTLQTSLSLAQNALTLLVLTIWTTTIAWWLPLLTIATAIPTAIARTRAAHNSAKLIEQQTRDIQKQQYYHRTLVNPNNTPELRLYGITGYFSKKYDKSRQKTASDTLALARQTAVNQTIADTITTAVIILTTLATIIALTASPASIGTLAMALMTIRRAQSAATQTARNATSLLAQKPHTQNLLDFLNTPVPPTPTMPFPSPFHAITLRDVSYTYPGNSTPAVKDLNISIKKGQTVIISGANGTGKTTTAKILTGLLSPDHGTITINGTPLCQIDPRQTTLHITALYQNFRLYTDTAAQNIQFGNYTAAPDPKRTRQAAQQADIHDLIDSLPQKYQTTLGPDLPEARDISRGQWQRLALARTLYSSADIIILDEPTTALDSQTRLTLQNTINQLHKQQKTIIIITHDPLPDILADQLITLQSPA